MRHVFFCVPLLLAATFTAEAAQSTPPACGTAALDAAQDQWDADSVVSGDLTLDGNDDVAFWKREDSAIRVYIAACNGDRPVETWRFLVPLSDDCPPDGLAVEVGSLLMDAALVDRVCAADNAAECLHMRQENERRRAIAEAGGRELRVGAAACGGVHFRWSKEHNGFMRIGA